MSSNSEYNKIESEVFRRLLEHLRSNNAVQNIDLMNLAGFCRNCLSKWYVEAAENNGRKFGPKSGVLGIQYNLAKSPSNKIAPTFIDIYNAEWVQHP